MMVGRFPCLQSRFRHCLTTPTCALSPSPVALPCWPATLRSTAITCQAIGIFFDTPAQVKAKAQGVEEKARQDRNVPQDVVMSCASLLRSYIAKALGLLPDDMSRIRYMLYDQPV